MDYPKSFDDYDIEVFTEAIPDRIEAMQKITVPYRITRRQVVSSLESGVGSGSLLALNAELPASGTGRTLNFEPFVGEGKGEGAAFACNSAFRTEPALESFYRGQSELFDEVKGFGGGCVKSFSIFTKGWAVICKNTPQEKTVEKTTAHTVGLPTTCPIGTPTGTYVSSPTSGSSGGTGSGQSSGGWISGLVNSVLTMVGKPCLCKEEGDSCQDDGNAITCDVCKGQECKHGVRIPNSPSPNPAKLTTQPAIPEITLTSRSEGSTEPDTLEWKLELKDASHAVCSTSVTSTGGGQTFTPSFGSAIMGGTYTATLKSKLGKCEKAFYVTGSIVGTDPGRAAIRAAIGNDETALKIACHESGMKQFHADGTPVRNTGGGIDIGIMQIVSGQTCNDVWDWKENVRHGLQLLAEKRANATNHHIGERNRLNARRIAQGLAACPAGLPRALSADPAYANDQVPGDGISEHEREAIRRYNSGREHQWEVTNQETCEGYWRVDPVLTSNPGYVNAVLGSNCQ